MRQLEQRAGHDWTGALHCAVSGCSDEAILYLFEGSLYAVALPWYQPRDLDRLQSAGIVDATRLAIIHSTLGTNVDDLIAARFCVEQGWLTAERLGTIHGEYLLASVGALRHRVGQCTEHEGEVTDRFCALPVAYDDLVEALKVRDERTKATWTFDPSPQQAIVIRTKPEVTPQHQVAEVVALLGALGEVGALDDIAGRCGLTRAEAAFIVSSGEPASQ